MLKQILKILRYILAFCFCGIFGSMLLFLIWHMAFEERPFTVDSGIWIVVAFYLLNHVAEILNNTTNKIKREEKEGGRE
jgi:hypothetical protein